MRIERLRNLMRLWWGELNGNAAYARYRAHLVASHPGETPLSRRAFFRMEEHRRWEQIRRCC